MGHLSEKREIEGILGLHLFPVTVPWFVLSLSSPPYHKSGLCMSSFLPFTFIYFLYWGNNFAIWGIQSQSYSPFLPCCLFFLTLPQLQCHAVNQNSKVLFVWSIFALHSFPFPCIPAQCSPSSSFPSSGASGTSPRPPAEIFPSLKHDLVLDLTPHTGAQHRTNLKSC